MSKSIISLIPASVRLEIRRAKGRIRETRVQDPKNPSAEIYVTDADFIDEPGTKAPWVIFEFILQDSSADNSLDSLPMDISMELPMTPSTAVSSSVSNKSARPRPQSHESDDHDTGALTPRSVVVSRLFNVLTQRSLDGKCLHKPTTTALRQECSGTPT
jgi:hypothetical protein